MSEGGLRIVQVTHSLLEALLLRKIYSVNTTCPPDIEVVRVLPDIHGVVLCRSISLMCRSQAWDLLPEGVEIPIFTPEFTVTE